MRERPILFSAPMVRAILAGQKTQTRRVINLRRLREPVIETDAGGLIVPGDAYPVLRLCPYGQPGDRLWVRETFCQLCQPHIGARLTAPGEWVNDRKCIRYAEHDWGGHPAAEYGYKMRPSIFMPRWASRILLEVEAVRVQQVQEMFADEYNLDVFAEGICQLCEEPAESYQGPDEPPIRCGGHGGSGCHADYKQIFRDLWNSINAKRGYGWEKNPWVWAITFRRIEAGNA